MEDLKANQRLAKRYLVLGSLLLAAAIVLLAVAGFRGHLTAAEARRVDQLAKQVQEQQEALVRQQRTQAIQQSRIVAQQAELARQTKLTLRSCERGNRLRAGYTELADAVVLLLGEVGQSASRERVEGLVTIAADPLLSQQPCESIVAIPSDP